jgi:CubicO group peptidase (beta-lactamase class C family)
LHRLRPIIITLMLFAACPALAAPDFSAVDHLLEELVADGTVAGGSVLVLHHGEVVFETGFGFADLKSERPFRVDTPCVIASISKPLLATAAFRLAEQEKLKLEVPISEYLPEFKNLKTASGKTASRAPTMIELFTHTSGLRSDRSPDGRPWFASWTRGKPLAFVVAKYASDFPVKASPGVRYAYSGIGTDVAARVAEVAAAKPRNGLLIDEVCRPLGMAHTYYRDELSVKKLGPMPTRYFRAQDGGLRVSVKRRLPAADGYSASGGTIISTAPDLARWLLKFRNRGEHAGDRYLATATIDKMLAKAKLGSNAAGGFFIRQSGTDGKAKVIGHTGSSGTNCWIDFDNDLIGIVLTQTRGEDIRPFRAELEKRVTAAVVGR